MSELSNDSRILSIIRDDRINATSILLETTIRFYLNLTRDAENNLDIQRKVIKGFKPYERLREDLKEGCIIPPVVIGIKRNNLQTPTSLSDMTFLENLSKVSAECVFIIDGLQRTSAIRNVAMTLHSEEQEFFYNRLLRVEVWPDITLPALTYRMILLNAGQKPMSLKHQLEIVTRPLCDMLNEHYQNNINIFTERDARRRSGPGQYQFSIISQAFQAFVQKSPHIDIRNEVIAELKQIDALSDYGDSLGKGDSKLDSTSQFIEYIGYLLDLDRLLCDRYPSRQDSDSLPLETSGVNLLTRDTFHLGIAAAYSWCLANNPQALDRAKDKLISILKEDLTDPLSIQRFEKITTGFRRKDNTGEQTRNLIFSAFKEFFRSEGLTPLEQCWTIG